MSLVQSCENRDPQEAMVLVHNGSLERIFSVQLTNGNSADVKPYLDMPLLVETNENEMFLNANVRTSVEDACNNNPHAINYLQNNFIAPNRVNIKEEDLSTHKLDDQQLEISESRQYSSFDETSTDSSSTSVSQDDVSESLSKYLIFHHKKRDQHDDSQLCYVMLQKLSESEIQKWTKPAMRDGESAPKRPRLQSMYVPSTKNVEPIQFRENIPTLRVSRSSSRNASKFEDISNLRAVNKQSNNKGEVIGKRTGKNLTILSSAIEQDRLNTRKTSASRVTRRNTKINTDNDSAVHTTNQRSADDGVTGQPKIILLFVRNKESGHFSCYRFPERRKKCYVPIERLSTLQSAPPCNKTPRRDCDPLLDLKANFVTSRRGEEEQSNGVVNDTQTLVFQETNTKFEDLGKVDISSSISLAPNITGAHTSPLAYGNRDAGTWKLGEKSCATVERRNFADNLNGSILRNEQKEETNSLYDDIEALDFTTTNFEDSTTMDKLVVESSDSDSETNSLNEVPLANEIPEEHTLPTCVQNEKAGSFVEEIDDNCSIASDISLFASDSETLYSPDRNKSTQPTDGWKLENYRIPKKPPTAVQKKPSEKSLDEQVEQILRVTTKKLPKMTSPVKDPPIVSGTKRKRKEYRSGQTKAAKESTKSAQPRKAIKQTSKQTHLQPSSVESNANTVPLEMGSDYDVKRKQQPNKIRDTGMLEGKPMEPEKTIKNVEQFNELRDICMLEGISMEPEKAAKSEDQFTELQDICVLEGISMEPEIATKSAEQFTELQDICMLEGISMEPETTTEIAEQFDELRDICMLEGIALEPEDTTKVTKKISELKDDGILEEAKSIEPEGTITTAEQQTDLQSSTSAVNRISLIDDAAEHRSSKESSELNQSKHPSESNAPLENITEITCKIDTSQPVNGMKFRSKIDFKNLGKVTINAGNLSSSRIVSIPNANAPMVAQSVSSLPVQSAIPQFEQPLTILSVPLPQPIDSVQNVVTHSQATPSATPVPLHGMRSVIEQSTIPPCQPSAKQPLTTQPVPIAQPINSVQGHLNANQPENSSLSPDIRRRYLNAILKLFERPCISFLANKPCAVPGPCQYSHQQLPGADQIFVKLRPIREDQINFIYTDFISMYESTFLQYFPMICRLFGQRKMEEMLLSSVRDCDKYGKYDFYKYIFGGLMLCGRSDKEALGRMVDVVDVCAENFAVMADIMNNPINPHLN